ncbi:hypothetical protein JCM8547_003038 [Rhodosporidiobolus lusitaniae]
MARPPPADVGTSCALPSCSIVDFLPLRCPSCSLLFCRTHGASPSAHLCSSASVASLTLDEAERTAGERAGPELRELLPDPKRHKREEKEMIEEEKEKKEKQREALEKLKASLEAQKKKGGTASSSSSSAPSSAGGTGTTTQKKVSPALALMKLKQRAKPADPKHVKREGDVPMLERVYLTVQLQEGEKLSEEKGVQEVWVAKTITAGKALDLFAALFKLNNQNNTTSDPSKLLSLALPPSSPSNSPSRLILSDPLSSQVQNGGTILLLKGYPWSA